jgi:hypothetical protein
VLAAVIVLRVVHGGQDALIRGDEAMARSDTAGAMMAWRTSLGWALPGWSPWRDEAASRLNGLADSQVQSGDVPSAVATLTALRAGRYASRTFWRPDARQGDGHLASLLARWEAEAATAEGRAAPGDLVTRTGHFEAKLAADALPRSDDGLLVVVGFSLWVVGIIAAIRRQGRRRWWALAGAVGGFAMFLFGLLSA